MKTVTACGHKGRLMAELRQLVPGEVLKACGYRAPALRAAVLQVERERRAEHVVLAIDQISGRGGPQQDRFVVCGADPLRRR